MGHFTPTTKAPEIDATLKRLSGVDRVASINSNGCVFCKAPELNFRDDLSRKEYCISGMCQTCQDQMFNMSPGGSA